MSKTTIVLAAVTLTVLAGAAYASPSDIVGDRTSSIGDEGSRLSLRTIVRNWDDYGFQAPMKPAQMKVNGRNGVSISGSDYAAALAILRANQTVEGRSAASAVGQP